MFQDKRISFKDNAYRMCSELAVCHWNEKLDRKYTSVCNPQRLNAPRSVGREKELQDRHTNTDKVVKSRSTIE